MKHFPLTRRTKVVALSLVLFSFCFLGWQAQAERSISGFVPNSYASARAWIRSMTAAFMPTSVTVLGTPTQVIDSNTLAFTVPAVINRLLVVAASGDLALDITSVTFNGQALTQAVERNDMTAVRSADRPAHQ
jgi:hypothetical protein